MSRTEEYRAFLKGDLWKRFDTFESDQRRGVPAPAAQKPYPVDTRPVDLVAPERFTVGKTPLIDVIARRKSSRKFLPDRLSLEELSFLAWATQGVRGPSEKLRTVPSAGARHPFETYLIVNAVEGIEAGLYRYLPIDHKLVPVRRDVPDADRVTEACRGQKFCADCAVLFAWTALPYRTEWRYDIISHKMIALDAGHLCQNLYLACTAIGAGTCGIGAYDHAQFDELLGVDGKDEFTVYLAPVGKVA